MSRAAKVRAAADYIERVGLHKGSSFETPVDYDPGSGQVFAPHLERSEKCCTAGALWSHVGEGVLDDELTEFLGFEFVSDIFTWNDSPERTAEEVVTKLREFADTLDAEAE